MKNYTWILFLTLPFFFSCVANRKYRILQEEKVQLEKDFARYKGKNVSFEQENKELKDRIKGLEVDAEANARDLELERKRYERLEKANEDLNKLYEKMINQNNSVVSSSSSAKKELTEQIAIKTMELDKKIIEIRQMEGALADQKTEIANLKKSLEEKNAQLEEESSATARLTTDLQEREKRVKELEAVLAKQEEQTRALKNSVNQALRGFSSNELTVNERGGKIYVSLSQELLFAPGSKVLDNKGKGAIAKLAGALMSDPDIQINVEGHTDADGSDEANWDLSVGRAASVVKELVKSGIDAKRITASGRGEHFPVGPNTTKEGKALNRRTEIILNPNLDQLYQIISK